MIQVLNYTKKLKNDEVLNDINLTFEAGKVYGLCGGNGSGKTMLLRAIAGLITPTSGEVRVNDVSLAKGHFLEDVGLMIGHTTLTEEYTGLKNLEIINEIDKKCTREDLKNIIEAVGLNPEDKRTVRKYSMGMNQKLVIAQAVMGMPKVVLLDEPTNSLDDEAIERVRSIILKLKEKRSLVILASHSKEDVNLLCDEIITLRNGKVVNHEKK